MAVIWQKTVRNAGHTTHYEVRAHGGTRRLYTDGVFHSQYNPASPVAGSVWDLLLLPAFFHPVGSIQRVLVLGVGGGAVIKQLQYFLQPTLIVGVEISPIHLQIARHFFSVKGKSVELVEADAIQWLKYYRGPAFDLIIDDLFFEEDGMPGRAVDVDRNWVGLLRRSLTPTGSIVTNFDTLAAMHDSYWMDQTDSMNQQLYQFTTPQYSNTVLVATQQMTSAAIFAKNLQHFSELDVRRSACRLNYRMKRLR